MFLSRASRTAAMMAVAMMSVEAKRSRVRRSPSYAFARFISPLLISIGEQWTNPFPQVGQSLDGQSSDHGVYFRQAECMLR
jgi:hypothetical protein